MTENRYTVAEIKKMRSHCLSMAWPIGHRSQPKGAAADAERALRTYMQNGTTVAELAEAASRHLVKSCEFWDAQKKMEAAYWLAHPPPPAPPLLKTAEDVIARWYDTCVAKYDGACATSAEMFDGFSGQTLKRYAKARAPDGVRVTQRAMERFMEAKGVRFRRAGFFGGKTYDGVQIIISGNVQSGNYAT